VVVALHAAALQERVVLCVKHLNRRWCRGYSAVCCGCSISGAGGAVVVGLRAVASRGCSMSGRRWSCGCSTLCCACSISEDGGAVE